MDDMICPKCGRDIYPEYEERLSCGKSKYVKIENYHYFFDGEYSGHSWDVECTCPECKEMFEFSDSDI